MTLQLLIASMIGFPSLLAAGLIALLTLPIICGRFIKGDKLDMSNVHQNIDSFSLSSPSRPTERKENGNRIYARVFVIQTYIIVLEPEDLPIEFPLESSKNLDDGNSAGRIGPY